MFPLEISFYFCCVLRIVNSSKLVSGENPQLCKLMETCQENLDHYQLKHCQNQIALFTMRCTNAISKLYQNWFDSIDSKFCIF